MIKIENIDVFGFDAAIRGCRNPYNSWDKSDSYWCDCDDCPHVLNNTESALECNNGQFDYCIGKNDLKLMRNLAKAGDDNGKFLRMINVTCDITAPLYWVAEHDTYKVATVRNSCSFMHKGVSKPFEFSDFTIENGCESEMLKIIDTLNYLRDLYLESEDFKYFRMIRQLLPQGYNVRYTWQANYQVLKNIYYARKNHRLNEWCDFCKWIETLPYFKDIVLEG